MTEKKYPLYYKQKTDNRFLKRIDDLAFIVVQVVGYRDGSFIHSHLKDIVLKEEYLDKEVQSWVPCTEEEYESAMATFFSFARKDGKKFSKYRQQKYDNQKSTS